MRDMFAFPRQDLGAGLLGVLVAIPLSLGIALASGVPLLSGLVAAVVGCLLVPCISPAPLLITGPAAGMTSIVLLELKLLGGLERVLAATMIAGALQVVLGATRAGRLVRFVPEPVVKGMLAGIGIYIIRTQVMVAIGAEMGAAKAFANFDPGPLVLATLSLSVFVAYRWVPLGWRTLLPAELVVVVLGAMLAAAFASHPQVALRAEHFVRLPLGGWSEVRSALPSPAFADFAAPRVWMVAFTVAVVASVESLVTLRAVDGIDPLSRTSPANRDLLAQGLGNVACGWLGGIPVTASAVRSFANVQAGARERLASLVQGVLLLVLVLFGARLLNLIPLASLAALLIWVGLRLASVKVFLQHWREGWGRFLPFVGTLVGVMSTDLLNGLVLGIAIELARRAVAARRGGPTGGGGASSEAA